MPTTSYQDQTVTLHHGDCLDVLRELPDASVDAVVTDPPYGLEFMGKEWDKFDARTGRGARVKAERATELTPTGEGHSTSAGPYLASGIDSVRVAGRPFQDWCQEWATECLRVLKPGGHMLAFGGTRTYHRLACGVEDAGFEIRDSLAWLYGSGFPKSLDVSKAIDARAGAVREITGSQTDRWTGKGTVLNFATDRPQTQIPTTGGPATPEAEQWEGWGTALKPAFEPIVVARKPLIGTVAANVLTHGTGALNIDDCRIEHGSDVVLDREQRQASDTAGFGSGGMKAGHVQPLYAPGGRWPANVILDESQAEALDQQSGVQRDGVATNRNRSGEKPNTIYEGGWGNLTEDQGYGGQGGASRFFYTAKADQGERVKLNGIAHPTVKPLTLMRWLVRLVTPPGGTVLEPFAGSGTTVEACILEGFRCVAIEREADYLPLIVQRINRRRDPVAAVKAQGEDNGLFDLLDG